MSQGGKPALAVVVAASIRTVGVAEIIGRETTVLKNCRKLCHEIVRCKPLSGLDEGEQRVA